MQVYFTEMRNKKGIELYPTPFLLRLLSPIA